MTAGRALRLIALAAACGIGGLSSPYAQGSAPRESIRIGVLRNGTYETVTVPLETYVARVLSGEAARDSPPAALEALAVTVRTYAIANLARHRADGFDLCDQTHCQVMRTSTPVTERAAAATAGQVLLYKGAPASVYYSASCGGRTEKPSHVWPGADDPPYLPSRPDDGCGGAPEWEADLRRSDLERALRSAGFKGSLRNVRVARRNGSGRVAVLALDGLAPAQISGQDLRVALGRTLGWQYIKSTTFNVRRAGDSFHFGGHGSGHGVGLCVIGATKLAAAGEGAPRILARYFPGTMIGSVLRGAVLPPVDRAAGGAVPRAAAAPPADRSGDPEVSLPEGDEGERTGVTALIARERNALALALGVPVPPPLVVRFHPTTDAYEQATGQPWFSSGTVVAGELHLLPLAVLRDRGILERTVKRQIVHVLVDATLIGRPAWVREGAAIHFAEPGAPVHATRGACPTDAELLQPPTVGALADASARARSCFERQLASRGSWRDVK